MEEEYFKISMSKVVEMIQAEELSKIRKFYLDKLGKATADILDSYTPTQSEVVKLLSR